MKLILAAFLTLGVSASSYEYKCKDTQITNPNTLEIELVVICKDKNSTCIIKDNLEYCTFNKSSDIQIIHLGGSNGK